jgi:lipopolysaccharide transport system permease protein
MLQHYNLLLLLTKREIIGRYQGSFLGFFWSFIHPILMLAIYTFVFGFVFKSRWGIEHENQTSFAVVLFTGLIIFNLFAECINKAPSLILNNINYVKKVVFPLEILPVVSLGAALFHTLISLIILLIFMLFNGHTLSWSGFLLPIVLTPLFLIILGLSWFLASIGVFIRDIGQIIGMMLTLFMFLSPLFYPVSVLPNDIQYLLFLNPLTLIIEQTRDVLLWQKLPDWQGLSLYYLISLLIAISGFWWFNKTRKGFADVL